MKHRTVEKAVERCELSIVEGVQPENDQSTDEDRDSLESKLIVRMHCKHGIYNLWTSRRLVFEAFAGVVKTHRLLLQTQTSLMAPGAPDSSNESHLTIGPRALKDMIEHFPLSKGAKSDPQLVWSFGDSEVDLKSLESSIDSRGLFLLTSFMVNERQCFQGKGQLSTELTISADEFDVYDVHSTPTTIAFHLREFNVSFLNFFFSTYSFWSIRPQ